MISALASAPAPTHNSTCAFHNYLYLRIRASFKQNLHLPLLSSSPLARTLQMVDLGPCTGLQNGSSWLSSPVFYCWPDTRAVLTHDFCSVTFNSGTVNYCSQMGDDYYSASFETIYCLNPQNDDNCPVGICPNPDIAGKLLRIARKFSLSFLQRIVI